MRNNHKFFLKELKRFVDKRNYNQLKKLNEGDFEDVARSIIINRLECELIDFENFIKFSNYDEDQLFFINNKVMVLPSKLKYLKSFFSKENFIKTDKLFNDVWREINCLI
jgi:hypothetical protein